LRSQRLRVVSFPMFEKRYHPGINGVKLERTKVRRAMESSLQKTAMKIVAIVNRDKDHIPPITTSDANPFPYQIVLNPKQEGYGHRFGSWN
jgi:Autophagy-related protein 101